MSPGTNVVWSFQDADTHNVTSFPNTFGLSGDAIAGSFEDRFTETGEFEYGCTIHGPEMSGYRIVVESMTDAL